MHERARVYLVVAAVLLALLFVLRGSSWAGSGEIHTLMEIIATMSASVVGVGALIRFYSKKTNLYLFVGTAFLGASMLDGYHTVVSSSFFSAYFPSGLESLIPWSWIASRMFLSVFLWLSVLAWKREYADGAGRIGEGTIYLMAGALTAASFLFFAFVPLPDAYFDAIVFHRPEEFVPAVFFLAAVLGYLRKGAWKEDEFEHCLVLSLVVGTLAQAAFMSLSGQLFDVMFDVAHLLKIASYMFVMVGLTIGMLDLFRQAESSGERIRAIVDNVEIGIITIDTQGIVEQFNPAAENIFDYPASEVIGHNINKLMPEPYRSEHDAYLDRYLTTGEAHIIGIGRDVEGRRRDGTKFPMELSVTKVSLGEGLMFTGIVRDITERKRVDQMKNDFISTVSHELRTPLTSVVGALGLLQGGAVGEIPARAREMIGIALSNSDRLVRLVNRILDIEQIESGRLRFRRDPIEVTSLVEHAIRVNMALGAEHDVSITVTDTVPGARLQGDSDLLTQVLTNLMSNAVKFSAPGDTVEIATTRRGDSIRFAVADNGPGVPDGFRPRLFERFAQADASDSRQQGGTGLGLSICKAIVQRHGGRIDVESVVDEGATFFFELPELRPEEPVAARSPGDGPDLGDNPAHPE